MVNETETVANDVKIMRTDVVNAQGGLSALFLIDFCNVSFVYQKLPMLPKPVLRVFKVCYLCFLLRKPCDG